MAYCINCGRQIPDDTVYCPFCGVDQAAPPVQPTQPGQPAQGAPHDTQEQETIRYAAPAPAPAPVPSPEPIPPYAPEPTEKAKWWIPVVVGVAAAAVVCGVFLFVDPFGFFTAEEEPAAAVDAGEVVDAGEAVSEAGTPTRTRDYGWLEDDYILPEGSTRYYTREELEALDSRTLWYARNEMYALHGKGFRTDELRRYFESKPWYVELYSADEFDQMPDQLNGYEAANEELMTQIERERNSPYLH